MEDLLSIPSLEEEWKDSYASDKTKALYMVLHSNYPPLLSSQLPIPPLPYPVDHL